MVFRRATQGRSLLDSALGRVQKVLEVGSEAADVLVHLQGGVTGLGLAAVGMRVVNSVREHRARTPAEFFGTGWSPLSLGVLEPHAYRALLACSAARITDVPGLYSDTPAVIIQIDGVEVAFALSGSGAKKGSRARTEGCWIPEGSAANLAMSRLARAIWEALKNPRADLLTREKRVALVASPEEPLFPSPKGDELYARFKLFLDAGYHRSLFMVGDPGVGKSALLRYIAKLHGGFVLQVRVADLGTIEPGDLAQAVEMLRPDVLIMQDFDRFVMGKSEYNPESENAAGLLDPVERINRVVPLFMASANFSENITSAMLRPERFDEVVLLEEVDPDLYAKLLPDAPEKILKHLRRVKAPVAYVQELRKRAEVLGYSEAIAEIEVLMKRADRVISLSKSRSKRGRKRPAATLIGKSPRRKASILETRAAREEKRAGKLIQDADKARVKADKIRGHAEEQREKAKEHEAAVKEAAMKGRKTVRAR